MKRVPGGATAALVLCAAIGFIVGPAAANEDCAQKFDRFAAEMDRIADAYDKMKAQSENCAFPESQRHPDAQEDPGVG